MPDELSLVRFCVINFFAVVLQSRPFHPIITILVKLVDALISSEPEPDKNMRKRLEWIYQHTHTEIDEKLSIIELAVFKNLDRGLNREIEIGDKNFYLVELYNRLDEISRELTMMVISIAKKYSIDIPMSLYGTGKQVVTIGEDETNR